MVVDSTSGDKCVPYLTLNVPQAHFELPICNDEPKYYDTILSLLDLRARNNGNSIAVGFPSCIEANECHSWTYEDLKRISIAYASRIQETTERSSSAQPIAALLAPSGPEFLAHVLGCWRLGFAVLPIAIGTTVSGALALMKSTGAQHIFAHDTQEQQLHDILRLAEKEKLHIQSCQWIDLSDRLSLEDRQQEPLKSYYLSPDDTLVIFHSSGSSGNPKPISQPHRFWSMSTVSAHGTDLAAFTTTPLFHGGLSDLLRSIQAGASLYCFSWHQGKAPTALNILTSMKNCAQSAHYFLSVPFILEMLISRNETREMLQMMELVSTGGAPLPKQVGDAMVNDYNIKLVSRMGSSECGFLFSSWRQDYENDKDWQWLRVCDVRTEEWLSFQKREEDGLFELVVSHHWPTKLLSNTVDGGFATNDLFEKHATQDGWWKYVRRADDSIVMVNGKKVASTPIEDALKAHDCIVDAIVFGADRPILGAVVLFNDCENDSARQRYLADILNRVNTKFPAHAQLALEMVYIVGPDDVEQTFAKLPRSSKGTLQRGLALEQLAGLIDDIYLRFEQGEAPSMEQRLSLKGNELLEWLTGRLSTIAGRSIDPKVDLYSAGVDSIMAARLRAAIHQHLMLDGFKLTANAVYEQQNLVSLAKHIEDRQVNSTSVEEEASEMVKRCADYLKELSFADAIPQQKDSKTTVLLTGATGALGSRILQVLMLSDSVERIICLVRAKDAVEAKDRVLRAFINRSLTELASNLSSKVSFVCSLEQASTQALVNAERAVIIQCAWIVNFALPLKTFEQDCLSALCDLLKVYATCEHPCQYLFCSSLAAVQAAKSPRKEEFSNDISDAGSTGYGQSKWVAEQICRSIDRRASVSIARIGQLCGDTEAGVWNESEAWPLLVRTANEIGALPANGPLIDWLPVDRAANVLVDIALQRQRNRIAHIALPTSVKRPDWSDFLAWLKTSSLGHFDVVPNEEWLTKIRSANERVKGQALLPIWTAMSTIDAESVGKFETLHAESLSNSMRAMQTVDEGLCHKFIRSWQASGFLLS